MSGAIIKPRIYWNPVQREWACSDTVVMAYGWGPTREAAYERWLRSLRWAAR